MTTADTPDHIRPVTSAQRLLGQFGGFTRTATIAIPPNVIALWLFVGPPPGTPPVTVLGSSTGTQYPAYQFPIDNPNDNNAPTLVLVQPQIDASVEIEWAFDPDSEWFVVGDSGPRFTVDPATAGSIGSTGNPFPGSALQVAGSDGTDLRTLLTDTAGRLETTESGLAGVTGTPGAAPPAKAIQVAGTDATDLRVVLTDSSGRVLSIDQVLKLAIGVPAAAAPVDAVQVAGSDGTDLRTIRTDATGALVTTGGTFPPVYAAPGAALPTDALLVGGSDGTDLRPLATDTAGHQLTVDQTLKLAVAATGGAVPADAVLGGGTDGTDIRAVLVDASGHQLTIDQTLKLAIGVPGSAPPADVVMIGGTDGSDVRAIGVSAIGTLQVSDADVDLATAILTTAIPPRAFLPGVSDGTDIRARRGNAQGLGYSIPSAPSEATGDHPLNEILQAGNLFSASGAILGAAGAGKRYRIFLAAMSGLSGAVQGYIDDSISGAPIAFVVNASTTIVPIPLSGLALPTNAGVNYTLFAGSGAVFAMVLYTLETI